MLWYARFLGSMPILQCVHRNYFCLHIKWFYLCVSWFFFTYVSRLNLPCKWPCNWFVIYNWHIRLTMTLRNLLPVIIVVHPQYHLPFSGSIIRQSGKIFTVLASSCVCVCVYILFCILMLLYLLELVSFFVSEFQEFPCVLYVWENILVSHILLVILLEF